MSEAEVEEGSMDQYILEGIWRTTDVIRGFITQNKEETEGRKWYGRKRGLFNGMYIARNTASGLKGDRKARYSGRRASIWE